ncbi:hypothetical protein KI659_07240 [Litoribacter alkaliphilus]|uniref:PQQ-binding-like beta-propeller repeat protein n=1 Tax=Litoribacter ruber TaxID=702568 RepID=A0AAP2G1A1_9BACT|nr:hypothetical protein [Litoribacter alkaliphilus]MBS9523807.1 hypothetical protein [Litoribacter alkaliphilus]
MKRFLLLPTALIAIGFASCEPSDDRPIVNEGMELKMDKQAVCLDDITTLTLTLGDSVVSPSRIKYEISPPVGSINEQGQYIAPGDLPSNTEVTITARPDFVIGSTSQSILVENARLDEYITTIEAWRDVKYSSYNVIKEKTTDGYVMLKENDEEFQIFKFNNEGQVAWVTSFGEGYPYSISVRNDQIYVAGIQDNLTKVFKLDGDGNQIWEHQTLVARVQALTVNDNGEAYLFLYKGQTESNHLVKLDNHGNEIENTILEKNIHQAKFNHENDLLIKYRSGNQHMVSKTDLNLNIIWEVPYIENYSPSIIELYPNNDMLIGISNNSGRSFSLKKISNDGNLIFEGEYQLSEEDQFGNHPLLWISDITVLENGEVLIAGNESRRPVAALADNTGHLKWIWKSENILTGHQSTGWTVFPIETGYMYLATYPRITENNIVFMDMKSILMRADGTLNPCAQANS